MSRINRILSIVFVVTLSLLLAAALPAGAQNPAPMPEDITWNGVWGTRNDSGTGSAGNDVYIVGSDGPGSEVIMHYDGAGWSLMSNMTGFWLEGVGGARNAAPSSDVFGVGPRGQILHYDGQGWSAMRSGEYENTLKGIWGSGPGDVFAVGEIGTILHYDGSKWSPMESNWEVKPRSHANRTNLGNNPFLSDVWGPDPQPAGASDVFAVGDFGAILHYDGTTWSPMTSGTSNDLSGVWGASAGDVFAVGDKGAILHFDGKAWTPMSSGTTAALGDVWGSSATDVFAVGEKGTVLHYDGAKWSAMESGTTNDLTGVWAAGGPGADVFAVGDRPDAPVLHYDGKTWSRVDIGGG